jgi:hypothetical protein
MIEGIGKPPSIILSRPATPVGILSIGFKPFTS